jgi:hypothetical protein
MTDSSMTIGGKRQKQFFLKRLGSGAEGDPVDTVVNDAIRPI